VTDLLTKDECAALAGAIDFSPAPFIDGRFRKGSGGRMTTVKPGGVSRVKPWLCHWTHYEFIRC